MLGKLFGSNARVKILKLFLLHPENKYNLAQLTRHFKLKSDSLKKELDNLESFGILASEDLPGEEPSEASPPKAVKKYFRANTSFPLFEEIRALVIKSEILHEKDLAEKIKKVVRPKYLALTGLFTNSPDSLVDLLIVGNFDGEGKDKITRVIRQMEKDMGREINYTVMSVKEFKYRHFITDVFLYGILEGKKIVVIDEIKID